MGRSRSRDDISFRTVGRGKIDPSADVESGTTGDNRCGRSHERRGARDDANGCNGHLGRARRRLLRHERQAGVSGGVSPLARDLELSGLALRPYIQNRSDITRLDIRNTR